MAQQTGMQKRSLVPTELQGLRPAGAYTFDELYRFAQMCQSSGLFEDITDAAQAMIKIVKGQEMGLPPTTAMSAFDIIKKRLFIKPWAIAAKINTCGYGGYRITEQTPERCTILFRRRYPGQGWVYCPPVSYSFAEAKAHGLVGRSPHWQSSPAHMLYQRAMGRGGAMYFPELLAGIEPPPDDTPIPEARHRQNIVDLFGDHVDPTAPAREEPPAPDPVTNARNVTKEPPSPPDATPESSQAPEGKKTPSRASAEGWAMETLDAHRDDANLPKEILEQIAAALSPLSPATESEALKLADVVLSHLDALDD